MDVTNPYATAVTGFFHGIIEAAAKDGEDIHIFILSLGISMLESVRSCREHGQVGIVANYLRKSHQMARSGSTDNIIAIPKLGGL